MGFVWDGNPGAYSDALISNLNLSNTTGLHFNLPCVETHEIVDMRTITLGVPPQEVHTLSALALPPPSLLLPALMYMSWHALLHTASGFHRRGGGCSCSCCRCRSY